MADGRLEEVRDARLTKRKALLEAGKVPYPSEVRRTHSLNQIQEQFADLESSGEPLTVIGRVTAVRGHGAIAFIDIKDQSGTFQLQLSQEDVAPEIFVRFEMLDAGDWIEASGKAITTKRGTQSLLISEFHIVSKSIRPLPSEWYGLKDQETRYRQREVDMQLNAEVLQVFQTRAATIQWIRNFLSSQGFTEVETPILQPLAGGATAAPFTTHHNALDMDLYLRIAPELYLKRLLVGGMEKVFEIGKNFRNEGISRQHNPEFTMLEFYWAFADYEDLMDFTDTLINGLVQDLSSSDITWGEHTLSLTTPIPRKRYVDLVSERLGVNILDEKNPEVYIEIFKKEGLQIPETKTYSKLVDELYKELIRPQLIQPVILYDYPKEMVPLAKESTSDPRVVEMFQLLIAGSEIVKAYSELNDPVEQRARFEEQMKAREKGDIEAQQIDESYIRALEYGMPPAGGYGLGIDRLVMLLANAPSLRDTILFPLLRPESE